MINREEYFLGIEYVQNILSNHKFDCLVALKRSGWIMGACLSNNMNLPLFSSTELKNIPSKFKHILLIDDKICTGKSINKIKKKLIYLDKEIVTCCMFVERDNFPNFYFKKIQQATNMFYEK